MKDGGRSNQVRRYIRIRENRRGISVHYISVTGRLDVRTKTLVTTLRNRETTVVSVLARTREILHKAKRDYVGFAACAFAALSSVFWGLSAAAGFEALGRVAESGQLAIIQSIQYNAFGAAFAALAAFLSMVHLLMRATREP